MGGEGDGPGSLRDGPGSPRDGPGSLRDGLGSLRDGLGSLTLALGPSGAPSGAPQVGGGSRRSVVDAAVGPSAEVVKGEEVLRVAREAWVLFGQKFALVYGVRSGVAVLARVGGTLRDPRGGPLTRRLRTLASLSHLLDEKNLVVREDAVRLGIALGGFSGLYYLLREVMLLARNAKRAGGKGRAVVAGAKGREREKWVPCVAGGAAAAVAFTALPENGRRIAALYCLTRALQSWYNAARDAGRWHFWGSHWGHGDTLLFSLSCAQIMYAYVMRPSTLSKSFWKFVVRTGPIDERVLDAVRLSCRHRPVDVDALERYTSSKRMDFVLPSPLVGPRGIPCEVLHPGERSCTRNFVRQGVAAFSKVFPLYVSLNFVPLVATHLAQFLRRPGALLHKAAWGSVRGSALLGIFVGTYQGLVCAHRATGLPDHRALYWASGLLAGIPACLSQPKHRRNDLALYGLMRAIDQFWLHLRARNIVRGMRFGSHWILALSCGALMTYYENNPAQVPPMVRSLIKHITGREDGTQRKARGSITRVPSEHKGVGCSLDDFDHDSR